MMADSVLANANHRAVQETERQQSKDAPPSQRETIKHNL
jgi:hypothetical protein